MLELDAFVDRTIVIYFNKGVPQLNVMLAGKPEELIFFALAVLVALVLPYGGCFGATFGYDGDLVDLFIRIHVIFVVVECLPLILHLIEDLFRFVVLLHAPVHQYDHVVGAGVGAVVQLFVTVHPLEELYSVLV